ncbi:hypothetical protein NQ315_001875 [Exocentrus adspersus]|uniref:DnaJ homolog subfamily C member 28 n=1 Tax=Exocentrus adspersus TaxID=1586481 RepID=A0AAV8WAU9_9CUCU|nr:hypothetical protein NQ315_001875 [Exocentrus adspersus]
MASFMNGTLMEAELALSVGSGKVRLCYKILEIDENSDQEQIRAAYLKLVKRYHPDSGTEEANADKFHEHTAPQHRQYLSYDGVGSGNPFQRQKQHAKVRAMKAAENVYEHRVAKAAADDKSLLDKNRIYETWEKVPLKHKIKTKHGFDRLVEDLIQESMSKGEFNNLKGSGKPLPSHQNRNPYVDFVTHKINEVLIDNGFQPEWIMLHKEIRTEANQLRNDLLMERKYFGPYPLSVEENIEWSEKVFQYKTIVDGINKKITKFNLVVPILSKQMLHISLENEAQKIIVSGKSSEDVGFDRTLRSKDKQEVGRPSNIVECTWPYYFSRTINFSLAYFSIWICDPDKQNSDPIDDLEKDNIIRITKVQQRYKMKVLEKKFNNLLTPSKTVDCKSSNNVEKPVKIILTGEDALRSQYVPPEPMVKILKRPSKDAQNSSDSKVYQPKKTLQQREQEYAQARLRILGEASPEKNDEKISIQKPKPCEVENVIRMPKGPDGTNGFTLRR